MSPGKIISHPHPIPPTQAVRVPGYPCSKGKREEISDKFQADPDLLMLIYGFDKGDLTK